MQLALHTVQRWLVYTEYNTTSAIMRNAPFGRYLSLSCCHEKQI